MSQRYSFGIRRFGVVDSPHISNTGQSRLNNYFQQLNKPQSQIIPRNNDNNINKPQNKSNKSNKSLKRKLSVIESNDNSSERQNKRIKLTPNEANLNKIKIHLSIQNNLNEQIINNKDIKIIQINANIKKIKPNKPKKKRKYHPIYDITSFPAIKLPKIVNPEETLMPEPIWIKKGNKIISDIGTSVYNYSLNSLQLDQRLLKGLTIEGYQSYFPVQKNIIPAIIRCNIQKRDIAVNAPTGSGKTLAYVLPICHILCKELSDDVHNLRGLVVAPSRDLAYQIYLVFNKFASHVGLNIGLSSGQRSLQDEQNIIMNGNIDILICTPGRLVNHLNHTQAFSLQHLQFLVLDEADRLLLDGMYQDWLFRLYHKLDSNERINKLQVNNVVNNLKEYNTYNNKICFKSHKLNSNKYLLKILVSATLNHSNSPKIISSLKLNNPLYFGSITNKKYLIPSNIKQNYICCFIADKLCNFISLIDIIYRENKSAICFCNTIQTVHRLKRILEIVFNYVHKDHAKYNVKVSEFSRMVPNRQRPHILRQFKAKKINFLICSDAMSRGLDLPNLDCVINYECPSNIEIYVHRIGRTARGIGEGTSYSIIMQKEKKILYKMLKDAENGDKLNGYNMNMKVIRFHRKYMNQYTELLTNVLQQEKNGDLDHNDSIKQFIENQNVKTDDE